MKKYFQVFTTSFSQEFVYKANFIMWRVRNVFHIFLVFFLWDSLFADPERSLFGYNREKMMTYVFGLILIKALVLSAKTNEIPGEIARGELSNYLLKPVSYFKYWLTRDVASKVLNLIFAFFEMTVLFYFLRPAFFFQTDPFLLVSFIVAIILAVFIFFTIIFITASVPFWFPEIAWGAQFLVMVVAVEFLSGALFPTDILPLYLQRFLFLTPFPYLIFFPLQVYLGKVEGIFLFRGLITAFAWVVLLLLLMKSVWRRGLMVYQSQGR